MYSDKLYMSPQKMLQNEVLKQAEISLHICHNEYGRNYLKKVVVLAEIIYYS